MSEIPRPQPEINMPEYGLTNLTVEDAKKLTQALREEYGDEIKEDEDWFVEWTRFFKAKEAEIKEGRGEGKQN